MLISKLPGTFIPSFVLAGFGPQYHVDCAALQRFAQPLRPGESTRELTLKIDVPVTPAERQRFMAQCPMGAVCQINLGNERRCLLCDRLAVALFGRVQIHAG